MNVRAQSDTLPATTLRAISYTHNAELPSSTTSRKQRLESTDPLNEHPCGLFNT
jgi:hypothetical protein